MTLKYLAHWRSKYAEVNETAGVSERLPTLGALEYPCAIVAHVSSCCSAQDSRVFPDLAPKHGMTNTNRVETHGWHL